MRRIGLGLQVPLVLLCALVIDWPVVRGAGTLYLDNPAHLAEIFALARTQTGWSQAAMAGIEIERLHSPLWYGLLAGIARIGLPLEAAYCTLLVLAHAAPSLVLLWIGRRFGTGAWALGVALLHLVVRTQMVGMTSVLGGMWTWSLAQAAVLLALDAIASELRSRHAPFAAAFWMAVAAFSHLFALFLLAWTVPPLVGWRLWQLHRDRASGSPHRESARYVAGVIAAAAAAAMATGGYWGPALRHADDMGSWAEPLGPALLAKLLALPIDLHDLMWSASGVPLPSALTAAPTLLLAAVVAVASLRPDTRRLLPLAPALLGLFGALFAASLTGLPLLGPQPHRMIHALRLMIAVAALPALVGAAPTVRARAVRGGVLLVAAAAAVTSAGLAASELRARALPPTSQEAQHIRDVFDELRRSGSASTRVVVQDTFLGRPYNAPATHSHAFALSHPETGLETLGPWYGLGPFPTRDWALTQNERLFGYSVDLPELAQHVAQGMRIANAGLIVVYSPEAVAALERSDHFQHVATHGRHVVFRLVPPTMGWVQPLQPETLARVLRRQEGSLTFALGPSRTPRQLRVPDAWSEHWTLSPPLAGSAIRRSPESMVHIEVPPGPAVELTLEYAPPRWPALANALGFLALGLLAWAAVRTRSGAGHTAAAGATPTVLDPSAATRDHSA